MKNFLLIAFLFIAFPVFSQENELQEQDVVIENSKMAQSIDALKMAYITKELNLSSEEAQKFWPIYNNYSSELKKARKELKQDDLAFQERKVNIMKRYQDDFRRVLNSDIRSKQCFRVEPEFHQVLRREWQRRHGQSIPDRPVRGIKPNNIKPNRIIP
jgi:Skp family chaperone for outer membrane proteins